MINETPLPLLAHTWGAWTEVTPATCEGAGSEKRACSACGAEETQPIAALGHSFKHVTVASTCTVAGVEYDECERCGDVINETLLPLAAHSWGNWTVDRAATCSAEGQRSHSAATPAQFAKLPYPNPSQLTPMPIIGTRAL